MNTIWKQWLALLLLASSTQGQTPCDIPSVPEGQTTTLTCHFSKHVWELKQKITVLHYFKSEGENQETVLFSTLFDDKVEYFTHPDYVLHNTTDTIKLKIPRVTEKHVGKYICMEMHSKRSEECTFKLKDIQDPHTDFIENQDDEYPVAIIIIIIAGIITIGSVAISAIIYIIIRSKRSTYDAKYKTVEQSTNGVVRGHVIYSEVNEKGKNEMTDEECGGTKNNEIIEGIQANFTRILLIFKKHLMGKRRGVMTQEEEASGKDDEKKIRI